MVISLRHEFDGGLNENVSKQAEIKQMERTKLC